MAPEIERRFLVNPDRLPKLSKGRTQIQGYLNPSKDSTELRVRIENRKAFLTIKSFVNFLTREEFEYPIPLKDAQKLLLLTDKIVEKIRFYLKVDGKDWVIDFFKNKNFPLVIAEIELKRETDKFIKPLWVTKEVTSDLNYTALSLAFNPFSSWKEKTLDKRSIL